MRAHRILREASETEKRNVTGKKQHACLPGASLFLFYKQQTFILGINIISCIISHVLYSPDGDHHPHYQSLNKIY